jgi:hypothetical protein
MSTMPHILADDYDGLIRIGVFVVVLILWGIKSLANLANKANQQQKERLRAVRQSIGQSQRSSPQRAPQSPPRPPVQLAPGIALRIPQPRMARPPAKRMPFGRPASNYNAMQQAGAIASRPAPPPLPGTSQQPVEQVVLLPETREQPPAQVASTHTKPVTVGAVAIRRWLKPATLRQQFILTELFQQPIALREDHLRY